MKAVERGRNDWAVVLILLLIGFLCVLAAGQLALGFVPAWELNTNMDSHLDPNSDFLTQGPSGLIQAIDPAILTQPSWLNVFLTPGASFVTRTPFPVPTSTLDSPGPTMISLATNTVVVAKSPTNTFVYVPPTRTAALNPTQISTATRTPSSQTTSTNTATGTPVLTFTQTATATETSTYTPTVTATTTPTATNTVIYVPTDPTPPQIGTIPDGVTYVLPASGTLTLGIDLIADGNRVDYDLVYYEYAAGSGIWLDWVTIQISDGNNWYTIFNWSDDIPDTNSNMNFNGLSLPAVPPNPAVPPVEEIDQRDILATDLYTSSSGLSTGIAIDVDAIVPPGRYLYIRFYAPGPPTYPADADGQMEIDAIEVLP